MPTPREEYIALCDDHYFNQISHQMFLKDLIDILRRMGPEDLLWVAGQSSMHEGEGDTHG